MLPNCEPGARLSCQRMVWPSGSFTYVHSSEPTSTRIGMPTRLRCAWKNLRVW